MKNRHMKLFTAVVAVALFAACGKDPNNPGRNYMPDMAYPVTYETYGESENPMFPNHQTALKPVAGTIPQGALPANDTMDEASLKSYLYKRYSANTPEGYEASSALVNPIASSDDVLAQGKAVYDIYCTPCHGESGDGVGPIVQTEAFPQVPDYKKLIGEANLSEGKMFHSITYGKNNMGSYSSQVSVEDRWKVIHYIQKLSATGRYAPAPSTTDSVSTAAAPAK